MQAQRDLSEFLHAELLHSLGVYNGACRKLESLEVTESPLAGTAEASVHCNTSLRDLLHQATAGPDAWASRRRPSPFVGEEPEYPDVELLNSIADFYRDAIAALRLHLGDLKRGRETSDQPGHILGERLAFIQDPHRRRERLTDEQRAALVQGKIDRYARRLADVEKLLPAAERNRRTSVDAGEQRRRFEAILWGDPDPARSLQARIVKAMGEAHMWMHQAEHVQSQSFGEMLTSVPETHVRSHGMLRYALVLNTFVYMAARATPWIFAEDATEQEYVIANHETCVRTLAPTYCMWISVQISFLALHRRAFTWWTMGKLEWAYRDFHKLIRLLRGLKAPAAQRGLRVPGTNTFIEGLMAMAELHIGRIYRGQHAHKMAVRYFDRASRHLKGWEEHGEIGELVKGSHWRVNLLLNQGKSSFQLGRVKRSILYYALAWRAYLLLVEAETHATANVEVVDEFTKWLEPLVDDPDIDRWTLRARVEPLVRQIGTLRTPPHLRTLAADIVMRLGHLLFVLKLPSGSNEGATGPRTDPPEFDHALAARCLAKAAFLDPASTFTATDLLKVEREVGPVPQPDTAPAGPPEITVAEQWPVISGRFEKAAQVTEYILQKWLNEVEAKCTVERTKEERIGLDLLKSFLAHTDSSNVKLAQVYRYLMQERREESSQQESDYSVNFVCMRRYSSFFPFVPRPSSFRAPGGGYFVQVREGDSTPFGIAVDPGPDFLENLYRCGYALADIQMVIVTHDHADHLATLDALLAVMFYRSRLATDPNETFSRAGKRRLLIVGNESVIRRYSYFNDDHRKDAVTVLSFEEVDGITRPENSASRRSVIEGHEIVLEPETLWVEPVKTWGHRDANGFIAQGFLLHFGPGADHDHTSILFTGDTGAPGDLATPPDPDRLGSDHLLAKGGKALRAAVEEADIVVAHLSSVPLQEVRQFARMTTGNHNDLRLDPVDQYEELWERATEEAVIPKDEVDKPLRAGITDAEFLLKQIQFGFRVRPSKNVEEKVSVSPFSPKQDGSPPTSHLYLRGLMEIAEVMASSGRSRGQLLLLGELREELGTFRTSIATSISETLFAPIEGPARPTALTADIGLRVRLRRDEGDEAAVIDVLCTTCDLDNDLVPSERFHGPGEISEICVKGEDEGVFYNCWLHDPRMRDEYLWVEAVERYDVFGE